MTVDLKDRLLGDYQLDIELGKGGMGTVYRAATMRDGPAGPVGSRVAIKVFHPEMVADERSFERFMREAEIGKRIRHPHVVRTFDIAEADFEEQTYHFMVMEFIEGQTLADLQADLGTVPESLLFQIADQTLDALGEVHQIGVIHRDIKPENIVITPDHRVLLMDLGIARMTEGGHTLTEAGEFVGSLFYAAPEQFLGDEAGLSGRCDLYAFGMVLYKLATGINPYESMELSQMLGSKLQAEVESPRAHAPDLDPFWVEIILTCTRRESAERFADAGELRTILQEGDQSAWWKARTADVPAPTALPALKRLRIQREVSLVGREGELGHLRAAYGRAANEGRVLLLGGPSGVGKSRLVYEFLEEVTAAGGPRVGAGRSVGRAGRNFHAFIEAFGDLLDVGGKDRAQLEERLRELLPTTPGMVETLASFLVGDAGPAPEKDALLAAFADLTRSMAAESPLILVFEDLQLAGPGSLDLFSYLARCIGGLPILLLGVFTEEEVEEGSELHEIVAKAAADEEREVLALGPLTPEATDELVGAVVHQPRTTSALAYPLYERADGNPNVMLEILAHLKTSGALEPEGDGYQLVRALDDETMPTSLQDLVNLRLGKLDEDQREVLEAAAILGYIFEASLLASVLEVKKIKLLQRLAVLERKFRLLKSSGRNSFRFASHQLHEAVYESITPSLRTEYHAVVADTMLEELDGDEPSPPTAYALLRHLLLSEQALEAEPFLEIALEYLGTNVHASVAAPFLERLADAFSIARPPFRISIATRLWSSYELLGQLPDQLRVLDEARAIAIEAQDDAALGRVLSCLAASHWRSGELDRVGEEATESVRLCREAGDRLWMAKSQHALGSLAYRQGNYEEAAACWREALAVRREIGDHTGELSSMLGLAAVLAPIGEPEAALPMKQEALKIAHEHGLRRMEAGVRNNLGISFRNENRHEEAAESFEAAIAIAREVGDQDVEALALGNLGDERAILGHVRAAKRYVQRAIDLYREIDRPTKVLIKQIQLAEILGQHGDRKQAIEELRQAIELAESIQDRPLLAQAERVLGGFLHEWGQREEGWKRLERSLTIEEDIGSAVRTAASLDALGHAALSEQQFDRAAQLLADSLSKTSAGTSSDTLLTQCRLAAALKGAGRVEEARKHATTAEVLLEGLENLSPKDGPEIHYRLAEVTDDQISRKLHLTRAEGMLSDRAKTIQDGGYREHFLTQSGHNPAILEEARRVLGDSG